MPFPPPATDPVLGLGLALATVVLAAAAFFPALRLGPRPRLAALVALSLPIGLAPLWIPAGHTLPRVTAALVAGAMLFKLWDAHVGAARGATPGLATYLGSLPNLFSLVLRRADRHPRRGRSRDEAPRLLVAAAVMVGSGAAVVGLRGVDWTAAPFAIEHAVKATVVFALFTSAFAATAHGLRLVGVPVPAFNDALWRARTPADFWNRYNRTIHQFLLEDVYRPARRRRSALAAILLTFAVSAVAHEYIFGIAIGRVQGYQTAFFLLQGGAVAVTAGRKPTGWRAAAAGFATIAFLLASSLLFFASFHGVAPIYARGLPTWLPGP